MGERIGMPAPEVRERIHAAEIVPAYESGLVSSPDFVDAIARALGAKIDYEEFCAIWSSIFLPHTLVPEEFVAALRRNYRTVLLSNTNEIHYRMLQRTYPILSHFDAYVLSYEVKSMKPEPAIYEATLAVAQCAAGECFFTDDMPDYVAGARRAGIDAVQFQGFDKLQADLAARGVRW